MQNYCLHHPHHGLCPWTPLGAQPSAQNTNTASRFCALHNGRTNPTLLRACNMSAGSTVCQWICRSVEIELLCTRHQLQKRLFLRRLMTAGYCYGPVIWAQEAQCVNGSVAQLRSNFCAQDTSGRKGSFCVDWWRRDTQQVFVYQL